MVSLRLTVDIGQNGMMVLMMKWRGGEEGGGRGREDLFCGNNRILHYNYCIIMRESYAGMTPAEQV